MKELDQEYRILVSVWREGETVAENFKFKTELCDDVDELLEGIKNFTLDTIDGLEERGDDEANEPTGLQPDKEESEL